MDNSTDILQRLKSLHPLAIDLSLDRIRRLLRALGDPHERLAPVIHVAGTNGKGSVTAFLKAMLEAAGRRVHVYTSPHLIRFNERILLAQPEGPAQPIAEPVLVDLLERVEAVNAQEPITVFEITTAAALLAFADTPADAVILEVGLGGRLDTTNVVQAPILTIFTPISIDHTHYLGDTIERIAAEKAGILKPDVPGIVSAQPTEALRILQAEAERVGAPLIEWGRDFDVYEQGGRLVFQSEDALQDLPLPALIGRHQIVNAGTAVAAAQELRHLGINDEAVERGLLSASWPARMQRLTRGPLAGYLSPGAELWLDGGHNPAAAAALAQTLADLEDRASKPVTLIVGMMGQKDVAGFLAAFRGLARRVLCVPVRGAHEAPMAPEDLAVIARDLGFEAESADDVPAAIAQAQLLSPEATRILICGSLYLAGHVLALQDGVTPQPN